MTASVSARRTAAPVPRSATWAVRAMYGGAVASIAGIAVNVSTLGAIRRQRPIMSMTLRASTGHQAITEFVVGGVIAAALWIFMAYSCRARMRWARIAGTVLFAVYTVYTAELVAKLDQVSPPGAVQVYTVVVWLIGLTATILVWQRGSSAYFAVPRRPERATRP
ncbi:MAG TPA: hypothetical protein VGG75_31285 [Trebonia sp.]